MQRKRLAVGVLQRRQPRIVQAIGDFVKEIEQLEIPVPQDLMGDHRVRGSDVSPQFDDLRFLHRGDGKAIARFEHRQSIYRRQLPEQQIAGLHPPRGGALGDRVLLLRHDIT